MAQFSGRQYKGAMRDRRALKRQEAEERQSAHDKLREAKEGK